MKVREDEPDRAPASATGATVLLIRSASDSLSADEAFDPGFVLAAFDQTVTVIFADEGLTRLFEADTTGARLSESGVELLNRLADYGLSDVVVCEAPAALPAALPAAVRSVDRAGLRALLSGAARVLGD